ncbi:murein transglycosylase A [Pararhizobium mangrovi]|uniref:peptidoglycan lytic exotransglycosylase n=1 Tax=Pararhizobium mangrovi TaxID=2590452 RepID=A0A506U5N4_9HYPH|nr:MltA domain-containing protein [Pararhizobium mangrovi]TPW27257.1 transglycosylase [Pararhizobium mangrovi]
MAVRLEPVAFEALAGWAEEDPRRAIAALARSAEYVSHVKHYRTGELGITVADLAAAFDDAVRFEGNAAGARAFFEHHFRPCRIDAPGFVTGYYEPDLAVSGTPDDTYRYPIHRRPPDLVALAQSERPLDMVEMAFGRRGAAGIEPYYDRAAIETGALDGQDLEIAYAADRVDLFFAHIQGAARLVYPDGRTRRITYAAKTGHPFTAIGRLLVERGLLKGETVTMRRIRDWLAGHPEDAVALMRENRSYIFFREADVADPALGPIAAAKVALEPGRSLAVDRTTHTFGTPIHVDAPELGHLDDGKGFRRLMVAQDTGSAIVGPARGDIFVGSGAQAGEWAGAVRHAATFHVLVPTSAVERLVR